MWRDGYQGRPPSRRQRYRCVNPDDHDEWHRFTPPVSRVEAPGRHCSGCHQQVPLNAGPIVPGDYRYYAEIIAAALCSVANGMTYTDASVEARQRLARATQARSDRLGVPEPDRVRQALTNPLRNGQLAADWVEVFTEAVLPEGQPWPPVLLLDSTDFWRWVGKHRSGQAFSVLFVYGYDLVYGPRPAPLDPWEVAPPNYTNGRLIAARIVKRENASAWTQFLSSRQGRPLVVVADGSRRVRKAVATAWPGRRYEPSPEFVRCQWHLAQNLAAAATKDIKRLNAYNVAQDPRAALIDTRTHALTTTCEDALKSHTAWRAYRKAADADLGLLPAFTARHPSATLKWLAANETLITTQIARRSQRFGPASTGPLEAKIITFRRRLAGRAQSIRNPDRTNLLLALMVAGANNAADQTLWADRIYQHLLANARRSGHIQRQVTGATL